MTSDLVHLIWKSLQVPGTLELLRSSPEQLVAQVIEALRYEGGLTPDSELKVREYILARRPLLCELLNEGYMTRTQRDTLSLPSSL